MKMFWKFLHLFYTQAILFGHATHNWWCTVNWTGQCANSQHILSLPHTEHFLQQQNTSALTLPVHHCIGQIFTGPVSGRTWHVPWQSFLNYRLYNLLYIFVNTHSALTLNTGTDHCCMVKSRTWDGPLLAFLNCKSYTLLENILNFKFIIR
jgi:hypothetical protein